MKVIARNKLEKDLLKLLNQRGLVWFRKNHFETYTKWRIRENRLKIKKCKLCKKSIQYSWTYCQICR